MIDELEELVDKFSGAANRTRCFAHIINLIAKTIIQQFDVPKTKQGESVDAARAELLALASDVDIEDLLTRANHDGYSGDGEQEVRDDHVDGWVDERGGLSASDIKELEEDVQPIRKTLVKVRSYCTVDNNARSIVADVNHPLSSAK